MKNYTKHNGWTVSLYTDEGQNNARSDGYEFLSWSPYDRIQIHITSNFEHFIFPDDEKEWCGVKQQLHLIPHYYIISGQNEDDTAEWQCEVDSEYLVRRSDSINGYYGLQCIVTGRLNSKILIGIVNGALNHEKQDILKMVTNNLFLYGTKSKLKFDCISFTTLGSEDFAFMLFADCIETFSDLLLILRQQTIQSSCVNISDEMLFSNICSIVGFNKSNYSYNPTMKAIVKINAKTIDAKNIIAKKIEEKSNTKPQVFNMLQGINVFEIHFSPKDLTLWHKPKNNLSDINILNGDSQIYLQLINSSRTFWQSKKNNASFNNYINVTIHAFPIIEDNNETSTKTNTVEISQKHLTNKVLKFILNEYNRMINFSRCVEWKKILEEQRNCLKAFDSYYCDTDNEKSEFADGMQAILTHINQACTPIYEVPYHNHFYAGSFDDILKMYYGIIKFIISKGNGIKREPCCKPTFFSFGIRFDSVENIQTYSFSTENQKERFVIFQLPYSALYDFETSAELLVHEVFHYIAPLNRQYRNKQMLNVWMEYLLLKLKDFKNYINKNTNNSVNKTINKIINRPDTVTACENLLESYYSYMSKMYEDFNIYELSVFTMLDFIEDACSTFSNIISHKLHDADLNTWNKLTEKAKNLSLCDEPDKADAMDVLRIWFITHDAFKGMIELASAVKEIFCDLFMCALYSLDLKQYIALLKKYKGRQKVLIQNDDMSLAYRIMIVAAILRSEYDLKKISLNLSAKECELIENELADDTEEYDDQITKLIRTINRTGTSPSICWAIIKTIEKEIAYLKDNLESFRKINGEFMKKMETTSDDSQIFSQQVKMMSSFMNYNYEKEETSGAIQIVPHYSRSIPCERYYYASSTAEYLDVMINISHKASSQLWYRGVCSDKFSLIPSLLREKTTNLSLYAMQVNYLKLAYSATINYPEMWQGKIQEHMSLLQHYGMPTSLLDFSLNMLTSLHFALNPDNKDNKKDLDDGLLTPVVYVFDPNEYANAVAMLREERIFQSQYNVSPVLYEIADDNMSDFFPTEMDMETLISHSKRYNEPYQPSFRTDKYPVPVIVRHSHARILVQGGTFVAYNLNSQPDVNQTGKDANPYLYLDLKQIELAYEKLQKEKDAYPIRKFLYEIHIPPSAIKSIQSDIKELKITKSSVYPELQNIFKEARENFQKSK